MKGLPTRLVKDDDGTYRLEVLVRLGPTPDGVTVEPAENSETVSVYWGMTVTEAEHYTGFRATREN
jgi:hypothetical protein